MGTCLTDIYTFSVKPMVLGLLVYISGRPLMPKSQRLHVNSVQQIFKSIK